MYCEFFGFSERPFDVTPDPRFLYLSTAHREMLASLVYGVKERRGFITIVGEVGTGKTTLLNAMLDKLDKTTKIAFVFNTAVTFEQMLHLALIDLGLTKSETVLTKVEALHILNDYAIKQLSEGNNVVIVVDEAQNLDSLAMENFRLLSNLETRKNKLIQIVLSGQPELDAKLRRKELRQLAQRINLRRYITPLDEKEMEEYIQHRLRVAGYKGKSIFSQKALQGVWEFSGGIPRKINVLCDNTFLIAYGLERKKITGGIVEEAINDLNWSPYLPDEATKEALKPDLPPIYDADTEKGQKYPTNIPAHYSINSRKDRPNRYLKLGQFIIIIIIGVGIGLAFGWFVPNWKNGTTKIASEETISENLDTVKVTESNSSSLSGEKLLAKGAKEEAGQKVGQQKKLNVGGSTSGATVEDKDILPSVSGAMEGAQQQALVEDRIVQVDTSEPPEENQINNEMQMRFRVVKRNDLLSGIIKEEYGTFSEELLAKILEKNPEIRNPDEIYVGQVISLPVLTSLHP
jgi:general secretion pathway protein A